MISLYSHTIYSKKGVTKVFGYSSYLRVGHEKWHFSVSQHLFNLMNDHLTNVFLPHHILAIVLLSTTLSGDSLSVTSVVELEGI